MITVYVYVLNTLADWEIGHVTSELHSRRFFKKDAQDLVLKTVSHSKDSIRTMGGLTIVPDCLIEDIEIRDTSVLILPGADTWNDSTNNAILEIAAKLLEAGGTVCAICGATTALASIGLLDQRPHTSNGPGFLEMFVPQYKGQSFYIDEPSVADNNLITASVTGSLLWAKQIIEYLDVFSDNTLKKWYEFFSTGDPAHFYALMQTLENGN